MTLVLYTTVQSAFYKFNYDFVYLCLVSVLVDNLPHGSSTCWWSAIVKSATSSSAAASTVASGRTSRSRWSSRASWATRSTWTAATTSIFSSATAVTPILFSIEVIEIVRIVGICRSFNRTLNERNRFNILTFDCKM